MIAVLACAGVGSRLPGATTKELYRVGDLPMIDYALSAARLAGCDRVLLVVSPGKEAVANHVAVNWNFKSVQTVYQNHPLGTGHALALAAKVLRCHDSFLYLMPDTVFDQLSFVRAMSSAPFSSPTVMLWPTDKPTEMGCFLHAKGKVVVHCEKRQPPWPGPYLAWGAASLPHSFLLLCREAWKSGKWAKHAVVNRGLDAKDFTIDDAFDYALATGMPIEAVEVEGEYHDCGTPARVEAAEAWLKRSDQAKARPDALWHAGWLPGGRP